MSRLMLWLTWIWAILYVVALFLFLVETLGLLGTEPGPLAGVFLVPLGMPWIRFVDVLPEPLWPWLGALAPLVNLAILHSIHRLLLNRSHSAR